MDSNHPFIEIFWNFWPLDILIWWPVKAVLNFFWLFFWIPSIPFYEVWNFIPEGIMLILWYIDTFLLIITF